MCIGVVRFLRHPKILENIFSLNIIRPPKMNFRVKNKNRSYLLVLLHQCPSQNIKYRFDKLAIIKLIF